MDRAFILSKIPEIGMIRQQELREKCLDTWLLAAQRAVIPQARFPKRKRAPWAGCWQCCPAPPAGPARPACWP